MCSKKWAKPLFPGSTSFGAPARTAMCTETTPGNPVRTAWRGRARLRPGASADRPLARRSGAARALEDQAGRGAFDAAGRALLCHAPAMQVRLNGELREIPDGLTVAGLLAHLGVKAQRVAVEVNETVVTKDRYEVQTIGSGDSVEIVAFVGGG